MTDTVVGTVTNDNLFAGDFPVVRGKVSLDQSQSLTRGAVLGIITATGYAKLLDTAAGDGSQNFYAVLLEDATSGAGENPSVPVALTGEFNTGQLSFGGATVYGDVTTAMRALSCFQKTISDKVGS